MEVEVVDLLLGAACAPLPLDIATVAMNLGGSLQPDLSPQAMIVRPIFFLGGGVVASQFGLSLDSGPLGLLHCTHPLVSCWRVPPVA